LPDETPQRGRRGGERQVKEIGKEKHRGVRRGMFGRRKKERSKKMANVGVNTHTQKKKAVQAADANLP
jgi:hypothetical protein